MLNAFWQTKIIDTLLSLGWIKTIRFINIYVWKSLLGSYDFSALLKFFGFPIVSISSKLICRAFDIVSGIQIFSHYANSYLILLSP